MITIKILINKELISHKKGDVVEINVDENLMPLDRYWRNRFRDSKIDNCITILDQTKIDIDNIAKKGKTKKED